MGPFEFLISYNILWSWWWIICKLKQIGRTLRCIRKRITLFLNWVELKYTLFSAFSLIQSFYHITQYHSLIGCSSFIFCSTWTCMKWIQRHVCCLNKNSFQVIFKKNLLKHDKHFYIVVICHFQRLSECVENISGLDYRKLKNEINWNIRMETLFGWKKTMVIIVSRFRKG